MLKILISKDFSHTAHLRRTAEYRIDFVLYNSGFTNIKVREYHYSRFLLWIPRSSLHSLCAESTSESDGFKPLRHFSAP